MATTFSHVLKGRCGERGDITMMISRKDAAAIVKKWSRAIKRSSPGHRTYFILHCHRGRMFDRLIVETHRHRALRGLDAVLPNQVYPFKA